MASFTAKEKLSAVQAMPHTRYSLTIEQIPDRLHVLHEAHPLG